MVAEAVSGAEPATSEGAYTEARRRLKVEPQKIAAEVLILNPDRPEWKPLLDSRRIVGSVLVLEELFPVEFHPDKLVRKGGYNDVDDIIRRHKHLAAEKAKSKKVRK
jgi:hypothetical protein